MIIVGNLSTFIIFAIYFQCCLKIVTARLVELTHYVTHFFFVVKSLNGEVKILIFSAIRSSVSLALRPLQIFRGLKRHLSDRQRRNILRR